MATFRWRELLTTWSTEVLNSKYSTELSDDVIAAGWLGYPGAPEEQIRGAELRIGTALPPSYRAFLSLTNGWRRTSVFVKTLWSTDELDWYAVKNQWAIDAWMEGVTPGEPLPSVPDEEYLTYGEKQRGFRHQHLQTTLEVSDFGDGLYLLNPQIVTADGEWESWFFAAWNLGPARYPSFWEMMQAEYDQFVRLKNLA